MKCSLINLKKSLPPSPTRWVQRWLTGSWRGVPGVGDALWRGGHVHDDRSASTGGTTGFPGAHHQSTAAGGVGQQCQTAEGGSLPAQVRDDANKRCLFSGCDTILLQRFFCLPDLSQYASKLLVHQLVMTYITETSWSCGKYLHFPESKAHGGRLFFQFSRAVTTTAIHSSSH